MRKKVLVALLIASGFAGKTSASDLAMTAMLREANSALLELKHAEREHKKELDMAQRAYLDVRSARRRQETYIKALRASYETQYKAERSSQTFHTYDSEAYSQRTVMPTGGITYYGASK